MVEFIGYHGTSNSNASAIINSDFRVNSSIGWLGKGAYLFEEDLGLAKDWAYKYNSSNKPTVIRCEIEVESEFVFDSTQRSFRKKFHEYRKEIEEQMKKRNLKYSKPQKKVDIDGKVYEYICRAWNFKLIRQDTYTYQPEDLEVSVYPSRVPNGTELCVRDTSIIKSKEVINV